MEELINSFKSRSITSIRVLSILTALWIAVMLKSGFCFNTSSSTAVRTRSDKLTNRLSRQTCLRMRKFSSEIRQLIIRFLGSNGKRLLPSDNGLLSHLLRERIIGCHREVCRNVSCSYRARCEMLALRSVAANQCCRGAIATSVPTDPDQMLQAQRSMKPVPNYRDNTGNSIDRQLSNSIGSCNFIARFEVLPGVTLSACDAFLESLFFPSFQISRT